jgi:hypothetical protein
MHDAPVTLCFTVPVDVVPPSIPVGADMAPAAFLVAQGLPPPQLGMMALVSGHEQGAHVWWPYVVEQLDPAMQDKQQQLADALRSLAGGDRGWMAVTGHVETVANGGYEPTRRQLAKSLQGARDAEKRERLTKDIAALDAVHEQFQAMLGAHQALSREQWLARWGEVRQLAQALAVAYWQVHQDAQQGTLRLPHAPMMPPLTAKHLTNLPSGNHFRALVQSFGPGLKVQASLWTDTSKPKGCQRPSRLCDEAIVRGCRQLAENILGVVDDEREVALVRIEAGATVGDGAGEGVAHRQGCVLVRLAVPHAHGYGDL